MTEKEVKTMLKSAYAVSESDRERSFLKVYEKRSLNIFRIASIELRYMGAGCLISGALLTGIFLLLVSGKNEDLIWVVSALIPLVAMFPLICLSRSERCGMQELEAASRFSLRFLRLLRMMILGIGSLVILMVLSLIAKRAAWFSSSVFLISVILPYFSSVCGGLFVTRKWHGKENAAGIITVCLLSAFLPIICKELLDHEYLPEVFPKIATAVLFVMLLRECILYFKESENISWNLC